MMLPLQEILNKYGLKPKGVIHVGAHWGEEHDDYVKCGIKKFVYIEPCLDAFVEMCKKFGVPETTTRFYKNGDVIHELRTFEVFSFELFRYACGSERKNSVPMYVSHQNQGQSNSLLEPNLHLQQHPEIVFDDAEVINIIPLDELKTHSNKQEYDFLVMDVQGYEGEVLKGATETLKHINIIYTEVNSDFTYANCMLVGEMDQFLSEYGFVGVEEYWPSPNWTWGDKIYIKKNAL